MQEKKIIKDRSLGIIVIVIQMDYVSVIKINTNNLTGLDWERVNLEGIRRGICTTVNFKRMWQTLSITSLGDGAGVGRMGLSPHFLQATQLCPLSSQIPSNPAPRKVFSNLPWQHRADGGYMWQDPSTLEVQHLFLALLKLSASPFQKSLVWFAKRH